MESFNYRLNQAPPIVVKEVGCGFRKVVEECLLSRYGTVGMNLSAPLGRRVDPKQDRNKHAITQLLEELDPYDESM